MTCPFTQTYAADAASPTCQAFWVQSIWAPHVAHGSDRRSVFSTTVTRLPKLHEREQRVCRRDAFLYCRCIFRRLCRLDISVGRSSRCGSTSPRGGNRAGVVFCGVSGLPNAPRVPARFRASASARTRTPSDADSVANFPVRAGDTSAGGSVVQAEFARKDCPLRTTSSAALVRALQEPHETLLLAVSLQPGEYRVCVIRYSPELGRTAQADR